MVSGRLGILVIGIMLALTCLVYVNSGDCSIGFVSGVSWCLMLCFRIKACLRLVGLLALLLMVLV